MLLSETHGMMKHVDIGDYLSVLHTDQILYSEKLSREKLSRISRILAFFAKVYLAKVFKMAIRESLSSEIFLKH